MRLRIHPEASVEIEREARYYDEQAPGLGDSPFAFVSLKI